MKRIRFLAALFFVMATGALTAQRAEAEADPASVLGPYMNGDTFVAGYVDLAAMPKGASSKLLPPALRENDSAQVVLAVLQGIESTADEIQQAGVDAAYMMVGLEDISKIGGPLLVFKLRQGSEPNKVVEALNGIIRKAGPFTAGAAVRATGGDLVLMGRPATLDRYAALAKAERPDLLNPLAKLASEGAVAAVVGCPGSDFRRVVRELWPKLPGKLAPLRAELADRWQHVELAVMGDDKPMPHIALQATDGESAEIFAELFKILPGALEAFPEFKEDSVVWMAFTQPVVNVLEPKVAGERVVISLKSGDGESNLLGRAVGEAVNRAMELKHRDDRMHAMRELGLALLNHESARKSLPAAAIYDKNGKPLLSWRVKVLPFLGDQEAQLYRQFHLDEPWDSPHNRELIAQMPAVFADGELRAKNLVDAGKTTYQVPVGKGTVFGDKEGIPYSRITDGTVHTVLLVEVEPSRAVEWTRPQDWEVDFERPLDGVAGKGRAFLAVFADGHVSGIPTDVDAKRWAAVLTRDGKEPESLQ